MNEEQINNQRNVQTRKQSLFEQVASQLFVFVFAFTTAHLFVYDFFGVTVSYAQNFGMMVYWTGQSIFLRYFLRRFFENSLK